MINELKKSCDKRINTLLQPERERIAAHREAVKPLIYLVMTRIEEKAVYFEDRDEMVVGLTFGEAEDLMKASDIGITNKFLYVSRAFELHGLENVIDVHPNVKNECIVLSINIRELNSIDE